MAITVIASCASTAPEPGPAVARPSPGPTPEPPRKLTVKASTTLPRRMGRPPTEAQLASVLVVDPGLLLVSDVIRPRVELRAGPGTQFNLLDQVLVAGQTVVVFEKTGTWFKVTTPSMDAVGYAHKDAISAPGSSKRPIDIPAARLPTVFAIKRVRVSYDYDKDQRLPVDIPKGGAFRMLKRSKWRALVWLPDTNGVVWLDRTDIE